MRKWIAGSAFAVAAFTLAAPGEAGAQKWFESIEKARQKVAAARAAKDSAAATLRSVRGAAQQEDSGAVMPAGTATSEAGGEVVRTSSTRGRRRPGCVAYDTYQCAASATLGEPADGAIGGNNYKVFYRFTVDQPGVVRFVLDPMPNNQGVWLAVTDAQYNQLATFNFDAGQPGVRLHQVAAPGTYYAHLQGDNNRQAQPFTFTVARNSRSRPAPAARPAPEPAEGVACSQNNTFQCAEDAQLGDAITGAIGGDTRKLFYKIVVDEPGTMEFRLSPMPNRGSVRLTVTDDQYEQLGQLNYPAGQPKRQLLRLTAPGTYFVRLDGGGQTAERFALTVKK